MGGFSIPNSEGITFLLYGTPSNKYEFTQLFLEDNECLKRSSFDTNKKTKILVHGYNSHAFAEFPTNVKNAYVENKHKTDFNVICVNWSKQSAHTQENYETANNLEVEHRLKTVASYLSSFLNWLVKTTSLNITDVHLVGHNFGAVICGRVGYLQSLSQKKKVGRISVLEPLSGIPVGDSFKYSKLARTYADFVDVYTTSSLGSDGLSLLGHMDFCVGLLAEIDITESHRVFSRTILDGPKKSYTAQEIPSYKTVHIILGEYCKPGATGQYLLMKPGDDSRPPVAADIDEPTTYEPRSVEFFLYCTSSNKNKCTELILHDNESLEKSSFDATKTTKVIIHGFSSSVYSEFPRNVKDAYLEKHKSGYNVICVNWGQLSGQAIMKFFEVLQHLPAVAECVSDFLLWLVGTTKLDLSNVHLVGHSLGAHVCGLVGDSVKLKAKALGRISGLDPSEPEISGSRSLQKTDADFVDVYHTGNYAGTKSLLGQVDFFFKGNEDHWIEKVLKEPENHSKAHRIFSQTVLDAPEKNDVTWQVPGFQDGQASSLVSSVEPIILGEYCKPGTKGRIDIVYPNDRPSKSEECEPSKKKFKLDPEAGKSK